MEKVSIIIPYNKDRGWLNDAIYSVKEQTYPNIELILSQSPASVGVNLNYGIAKATGSFIKYLCDDDLLPPNSIEQSIAAFTGPEIDFIHGCATNFWMDINKEEVYIPTVKRPTLSDMLEHNQIHGGTLMYRASVFRKFGFFDPTLWTGEEYEFNLRLLNSGAIIGYSPDILYKYRRHQQQKSLGNKNYDYQARRREAIESIKNRYRP